MGYGNCSRCRRQALLRRVPGIDSRLQFVRTLIRLNQWRFIVDTQTKTRSVNKCLRDPLRDGPRATHSEYSTGFLAARTNQCFGNRPDDAVGVDPDPVVLHVGLCGGCGSSSPVSRLCGAAASMCGPIPRVFSCRVGVGPVVLSSRRGPHRRPALSRRAGMALPPGSNLSGIRAQGRRGPALAAKPPKPRALTGFREENHVPPGEILPSSWRGAVRRPDLHR